MHQVFTQIMGPLLKIILLKALFAEKTRIAAAKNPPKAANENTPRDKLTY